MGKKLAIRGHSTRGKEVIELLEMLGGKNIREHKYDGSANMYSYYLVDNIILSDRLSIAEDDDFEIFTLQGFLEKFPYKVGDKVHIYVQNDDIDGRLDTDAAEITSMRWNPDIRKIAYKMKNIKREFYKEEIKCKVDDSDKPTKAMGKKLAIKGHPTRGEEIIELLKMLGDCKNAYDYTGCLDCYYYITEFGRIESSYKLYEFDNYIVYTLEEFLEKFPFKIHDLVNIPEYESTVGICGMRWDPYSKCIEYMVYRCDDEEWYTAEELLNWNDNPNETTDCKKCGLKFGSVQCFDKDCPNNTPKDMEEKKINQMSLVNCDLDEVEIVLGDKFELKIQDGKYFAVRKKSKYPTTYKECCEIVNACPTVSISYDSNEDMLYNDEVDLTILALRKLIICRNAYWKIAGEEMGLDGPWKPNEASINAQYGIRPLLFPSKEIYNMFYDNFKDLIEQCKELL